MNFDILASGGAKLCLGVSVWGVVMAMDAMQIIPRDTYGLVTKYAGLTAGALYAAKGVMTILNGRE